MGISLAKTSRAPLESADPNGVTKRIIGSLHQVAFDFRTLAHIAAEQGRVDDVHSLMNQVHAFERQAHIIERRYA